MSGGNEDLGYGKHRSRYTRNRNNRRRNTATIKKVKAKVRKTPARFSRSGEPLERGDQKKVGDEKAVKSPTTISDRSRKDSKRKDCE